MRRLTHTREISRAAGAWLQQIIPDYPQEGCSFLPQKINCSHEKNLLYIRAFWLPQESNFSVKCLGGCVVILQRTLVFGSNFNKCRVFLFIYKTEEKMFKMCISLGTDVKWRNVEDDLVIHIAIVSIWYFLFKIYSTYKIDFGFYGYILNLYFALEIDRIEGIY